MPHLIFLEPPQHVVLVPRRESRRRTRAQHTTAPFLATVTNTASVVRALLLTSLSSRAANAPEREIGEEASIMLLLHHFISARGLVEVV